MRRVSLPSPALYPLLMFAAAGVIYGAATLVHGSGFLAVFVAASCSATGRCRTAARSTASSPHRLAEIAMFIALGLTIDLTELSETDAWSRSARRAARLSDPPLRRRAAPTVPAWGERLFVMWSGLKGAVPILLAALALIAGVDDGQTIYGIVFVVVLFSVLVQGTLVPVVAEQLGVPMEDSQS